MDVVVFILLLLGAISFGAAAFGVAARVNLIGLGLFFWILVPLIPAAQALAK